MRSISMYSNIHTWGQLIGMPAARPKRCTYKLLLFHIIGGGESYIGQNLRFLMGDSILMRKYSLILLRPWFVLSMYFSFYIIYFSYSSLIFYVLRTILVSFVHFKTLKHKQPKKQTKKTKNKYQTITYKDQFVGIYFTQNCTGIWHH